VNGEHEAKKYALNKDILTSRHRAARTRFALANTFPSATLL
jgi:hypothetical protein